MSDSISTFPNYGNQNTTHESIYLAENMSKVYDIDEILEVMFPITFNIMYWYKRKECSLTKKHKHYKYIHGYFCGLRLQVLGQGFSQK